MFWRSVFDIFDFSGSSSSSPSATDATVVNPSTGLPMMNDSMGGVDVGGRPYGIDTHHDTMDSFISMNSNPWD